MKHKYLFCAIVSLIGTVACSVVETKEIMEPLKIVFEANPFYDNDLSLDTKTSVEPNESYSEYLFSWSDKDTVGIYPNKGSQVYFEMTSGAGASSAEFDGGGWDFKPSAVYRSYYPFIGDIYLDATKIPVSFTGQVQNGNNSSAHFSGYDYMYTPATSNEEGKLHFSYKHLITALYPWVELPAGHYTKLTLSLAENLFVKEGKFDLTSDNPAIEGKTFSDTQSVDLDITFTQNETLKVYVVLAPIDISGKKLTITVFDEEGKQFAYSITPKNGVLPASKVNRVRSSVSFATGTVSLDQTTVSLIVGESQQFTATVLPENAADKSVTWTSSNTDVATVDALGNVTAVAVGSTTITATATQGGNTATCAVTVNPVEVTSVELNKTELTLNKGSFETLTATVLPENATDKTVTWSSSNTAIATVDATGKVTAVAGGSATVTAASGGKSATCAVTVTVPVSGVSLNKTSTDIFIGSTETLTATVTPADATNKAVSWTSDNTAVATVSSTGVVTAVAVGSANITVCTTDGNKTASCSVTVNPIAVTSIELNKSTLSLVKGNSETLTATVSPSNATSKSVTWTSSNTAVASVDTNGKVTAVGGGSATITASAGGKSAACEVTVTVPVTGVSLNKSTTSIVVGNTETLTATVAPSDATNKAVTWTSNAESVATVSSTGVVTAVAVGTATITVKTADGNKTAACTVTVSPIAITGISLNKSTLSLTKGSYETLTATITPENATYKTVTWGSSNNDVATVDANGKVTAVAGGSATITATAGGKSATCVVTVTVPVTGVSLDKTSLTFSSLNATQQLTATVAPEDATNMTVTWSSNNTSVATVSTSGLVTSTGSGSATITVKTADGNKTATCTVTVAIPVTGVSLDRSSLSFTSLNATQQLTATVAPSNATNKNVTWSSSNTSVATVSSTGLVTSKGSGSATITVKTADGNKTATCSVTVAIPVTGVALDQTSLSFISLNATQQLTAAVTPSNATNKSVTWTSSNTSVATVSSAGLVTTKGWGDAVITVKTADGNYTATCSVNVGIPVTSIRIFSQNQNAEVTSLSMYPGDTDELSVVCYPENATNKADYTNTSNQYWRYDYKYITGVGGSMRIDEDCNTGISQDITVSVKGLSASVTIHVLDATPLPVNLGLSVNWADRNLYSTSAEGTGRFYTWKEAARRNNTTSDIAQYATEGAWRMPTKDEIQELLDYCTVSNDQVNGVSGVRFTSKTNTSKSIFLPDVGGYQNSTFCPASQIGVYYWSSTSDGSTSNGYRLRWITSNHTPSVVAVGETSSVYKFVVRPVSATVNQIDVTSVKLNTTSTSINVGGTVQLTATVSPGNASDKTITWTSDNESVASVSSLGVVTGIAPGTNVKITAKAGNKTASCYVTVNKIAVTSVTLDKTSLNLNTGQTSTLHATVSPNNATYSTVSWSSGNTSVATVSSSGVVSAVGPGYTTIYATADGKNASCSVSVKQLVTGLSMKSSTTIRVGKSEQLNPTILPSNASNKSLTWTSSSNSVATVTNGSVLGKSAGTAIITATTTDGTGLSASCTVTVESSGKTFPTSATFDADAYITYVANQSFAVKNNVDITYESVFPCTNNGGYVSGVKVEMKFQVDNWNNNTWSWGPLRLGSALYMDKTSLFYRTREKDDDGDWDNYDYNFIRWSGSGISFTDVLTVTATYSGTTITSDVNGVQQSNNIGETGPFYFYYVFSQNNSGIDDGDRYDDYLGGVPDGARLYYVKIWDSSNNLVYFGYAAKSVNPDTGQEEYCWYSQKTKTYTFANNHLSTGRQPFGGGID